MARQHEFFPAGVAAPLMRVFSAYAPIHLWILSSTIALGVAYFSIYPVGFYTTTFAFGLYLLVRAGRGVLGGRVGRGVLRGRG